MRPSPSPSSEASPGTSRLYRAVATVALATVAALGAACGSFAPAGPPAGVGIVQDRPVRDLPLVSESGTSTSLGEFRGKYVVMAPFLTSCQEECPLVTGAFIALQHDVETAGLGDKVVFVEVSVDPWRDTPARLRAYSSRFGADWPLLTGTQAELSAFWKFFYVYFARVPEGSPAGRDWLTGAPYTFDVQHSNGFILIDRSGHERFITTSPPNLHGKLEPQLAPLLDKTGLQALRHQQSDSWTLSQAAEAIGWLTGTPIPEVTGT